MRFNSKCLDGGQGIRDWIDWKLAQGLNLHIWKDGSAIVRRQNYVSKKRSKYVCRGEGDFNVLRLN